MVNRILQPIRSRPALEAFISRLAGQFTTRSDDDFEPFGDATSIAPETFEMRFMKLHAEGRFDAMWEMLAEDSKRAWGGRERFMRDMPRLDGETELLDMHVVSVTLLEDWTDREHQRTYNNVARLVMRYRVRQQWRESTFDRQVHLVPAEGGWRTLCYPRRTAVGR